MVPELLRAKVRVFADLYRKTRQLEQLNVELERRVGERTAELAQANADLERRVEERTREREAALAQVHEMLHIENFDSHFDVPALVRRHRSTRIANAGFHV